MYFVWFLGKCHVRRALIPFGPRARIYARSIFGGRFPPKQGLKWHFLAQSPSVLMQKQDGVQGVKIATLHVF